MTRKHESAPRRSRIATRTTVLAALLATAGLMAAGAASASAATSSTSAAGTTCLTASIGTSTLQCGGLVTPQGVRWQ